jgi:hypothetical protein
VTTPHSDAEFAAPRPSRWSVIWMPILIAISVAVTVALVVQLVVG